ncbi:MAG: Biotin lipoyl 2 protein [Patescibacteria group bacterium]|nr:Biotin lipoyl 2 protein [Patescibacteria group bacterium]
MGDRVEKGQLLATVDNREADISATGYAGSAEDLERVEGAVRNIGDSVKALAESRALVSEAEVRTAEIGKKLALRDLELAKKNLENSRLTVAGSTVSASERVKQAEQSLSLAKSQLDNTSALLSEQESSLRSSALASLALAFVTARSGRDFADGVLGVTEENRHKNDAYENYLGAKDSATMARADTAFRTFNGKYENTYAWYYANVALKTDVSFEVAKEALVRASETLVSEREALHALKSVLEKTVESSSLDAAAIAGYEQKTDSLLSGLEASVLSA